MAPSEIKQCEGKTAGKASAGPRRPKRVRPEVQSVNSPQHWGSAQPTDATSSQQPDSASPWQLCCRFRVSCRGTAAEPLKQHRRPTSRTAFPQRSGRFGWGAELICMESAEAQILVVVVTHNNLLRLTHARTYTDQTGSVNRCYGDSSLN